MSWIPSPSRPVFHVTSLSTLLPYWNLGLLNSIVQRRSWNLSLAPSITRVKSFIPQGHTFIWQMINLLSAFWRDDHPIRLNREFHLDLSWSREFFISWDGLRFLLIPHLGTITWFLGVIQRSWSSWLRCNFWPRVVCGKMVHCSTTFINSLQGTFSRNHSCHALGPHMGHKTGGVLFG